MPTVESCKQTNLEGTKSSVLREFARLEDSLLLWVFFMNDNTDY